MRHDSVSNHQLHDCFLNRLFRHRSKKTSKLRVAGLCEFPAQMASTQKMFPFDDVIMMSFRVAPLTLRWSHCQSMLNIVKMPTLSSPVVPKVVITTTSCTTSDDKVDIMTNSFFLRWSNNNNQTLANDVSKNGQSLCISQSWWRHQMETFSALLTICARNSPVPGELPAQRSVTRSFDVFFDLRLNKRLSKQSWGWWFEMRSRPLWRHRNILKHNKAQIPGIIHWRLYTLLTSLRFVPLDLISYCIILSHLIAVDPLAGMDLAAVFDDLTLIPAAHLRVRVERTSRDIWVGRWGRHTAL